MTRRAGSHAWATAVVSATRHALEPLRDPQRAESMARYMKGIAPFLGVSAPDRRAALKSTWKSLPAPTSDELGTAALALTDMTEREYHYAAYDLIDRYRRSADERFLERYGAPLLCATPWWDTVDGLVTAMVSPQCRTYDHSAVIDQWSESGDRWLIRSAITHQRGWKGDTQVARVLSLCDRHWDDREFFIAKAIGWAMRDIARMDPASIRAFLKAHPAPNAVARREALRGLPDQ